MALWPQSGRVVALPVQSVLPPSGPTGKSQADLHMPSELCKESTHATGLLSHSEPGVKIWSSGTLVLEARKAAITPHEEQRPPQDFWGPWSTMSEFSMLCKHIITN
jgi:hypothetical protein